MDIVTFFISQTQSTLIEQPIERRLHHIAVLAKAAAMFRITSCNLRHHIMLPQRLTNLFLSIIRTIRKDIVRPFSWTSMRLLDRRNALDQRDGHFRIMNVGTRVLNSQWCTSSINYQMTFRAIFAPIRGIWACFRPPKSARTEQLSMAATDQSIASAIPNLFSSVCHIFCQTPAACQSRRRRQQVMPLPHPISRGRYSHGVPVLSTKRIPVRQARSGMRGRPPLGLGGSGGICDFICSHSSSVSSGLAIIISSMTLVSVWLLLSFRTNHYSIFRFC